MTFTYNSTNIGSSGLATVRFYTGETTSEKSVLTDEEIQAVLSNLASNYKLAAAICCDSLSAYYADQADTRNEGLDIKASQRSAAYAKKAAMMRRQSYVGAEMFVGGRSIQTKVDRQADTDLVQPAFTIGQDDFPGTVGTSTG